MVKKLILIGLLFSFGCKSIPLTYRIGQSETDFFSINATKRFITVEDGVNRTVYKICDTDFYTGQIYNCRFFYFKNGILVQYDHGVREPGNNVTIYNNGRR